MKKKLSIKLFEVVTVTGVACAILFGVAPMLHARSEQAQAGAMAHARKIGQAILMYTEANDGVVPLAGYGDSADPLYGYQAMTLSTWTQLVAAYLPSTEALQDPRAPRSVPMRGTFASASPLLAVQFGYNVDGMVPLGADRRARFPVSYAAIVDPARTVAVASRTSNAELLQPEDGADIAFSWDTGALGTLVFPPVSPTAGNWRKEGLFGGDLSAAPSPQNGGSTGLTAFRGSGTAIAGMADGSAKPLNLAQAAAGTNFRLGLDERQVRITDPSRYLWDTR